MRSCRHRLWESRALQEALRGTHSPSEQHSSVRGGAGGHEREMAAANATFRSAQALTQAGCEAEFGYGLLFKSFKRRKEERPGSNRLFCCGKKNMGTEEAELL